MTGSISILHLMYIRVQLTSIEGAREFSNYPSQLILYLKVNCLPNCPSSNKAFRIAVELFWTILAALTVAPEQHGCDHCAIGRAKFPFQPAMPSLDPNMVLQSKIDAPRECKSANFQRRGETLTSFIGSTATQAAYVCRTGFTYTQCGRGATMEAVNASKCDVS